MALLLGCLWHSPIRKWAFSWKKTKWRIDHPEGIATPYNRAAARLTFIGRGWVISKGKNSEKNSVDIHENSFGFCSLIIPVNFPRDYPCLFSSVFFFRCTFRPFFYPMSFLLQSSSFVVPFARSAIPCLFHFSSLRSSNTLNTSAVTEDF